MQASLSVNPPSSRLRWRRPSLGVIALGQCTVLALFALFSVAHASFGEASFLLRPLAGLMLIGFVWSLWSWKSATGDLFDPYVIFLVSAHLFNEGQVFLEFFGLNRDGLLGGVFDDDELLEAMLFVGTGLAALHLAALLWLAWRGRPRRADEIGSSLHPSFLSAVGWALLAVSIVPFLWVMRQSVATVLASGYKGLYQTDVGVGVLAGPRILAFFIIPAAIYLLVGNPDRPRVRLLATGIILLFSTLHFFLGYRGIAAMPLLAYAWAYHRTVRCLSRRWIIPALFLGFVVLPTIGVARSTESDGSYVDAFLAVDNPVVSVVSEIGGSMNAVVYTQQLVPQYRDYDRGRSYLLAGTTTIPNLFWAKHPAVAHGTFADWMTRTVAPFFWATGGGLGYSFIAETYANFGEFGGLLAMFALGAIFAAVFSWGAFSDDRAKIAVAATFLSFLAYFARGESLYVVRPLVWYALMPASMAWLLAQVVSRRGRPAKRKEVRHG